MVSQRCSLLIADVHTLKALPPSEDLVALRGGLCKAGAVVWRSFSACEVGSGSDFLDVKEAKLGPNNEWLGKKWLRLRGVSTEDEALGVCQRTARSGGQEMRGEG